MTKDDRKVALVTGGSGGIGRVVSLRLAKDGFSVVLHYAGNAEKAEQVANEIKAADGQTVVIQADVSNETDVERMFKQIIDTFGRIDVVVHTAGIMPVMTIAETDLTVFDRIISTNLRGTLIVFKHAAKNVAEGGRIMAFSSSVIAKSFPTYGPYIASKAGVEGLVHVLTNELRGRNITVNAVAPGPIPTELFLKGKSEARIDEFKEMSPLERLGQPEDIAGVVSFLAGPDGGWVNGQVVRVNGGFA
ncbi:MAG TPA: SDR family oxidoreductase [Pyrinomonadaceae bacterium]|nr:SDR family oxidoreductase [Pyrinomonadaceae bacterium]